MKIHLNPVLAVFVIAAALRTAAVAAPERVLMIGDSMMQVPAHALKLALDKREGVSSHSHTSIGSGLARLDAFDWMAKTDELVKDVRPDLTVVWFGTNDRQPMQTDSGVVNVEDPGWEKEYARRIGVMMDKLTADKGSEVYWLELPMMRDKDVTANVDIINRLVKAEAEKRKAVTFYPTRGLLGRRPDVYSANVMSPQGRMIMLRSSDGIHLTRQGADRIAEALDKEFYK